MILNGWDEELIGGIDSGSDISDVEDPEYCPSGHVRLSETRSAPAEQDQSDTEESSESSEEEMDIVLHQHSDEEELSASHLRDFKLTSTVLKSFYTCTIGSITAWFVNNTKQDFQGLQRMV
ncbi:hypothetical protein MHYP_G00061590 [Metynnis hypsauchen]